MKIALLALTLVGLPGCCGVFRQCPLPPEHDHARSARILADFSKTVTAYYAARAEPVPDGFDAAALFAVLDAEHPAPGEVADVKNGYRVRARKACRSYAVMLCDPTSGAKVMEDLGCTTARVDLRAWERPGAACDFELDPAPCCG